MLICAVAAAALALPLAAPGTQAKPPKGFTRLEWKKPKELVKAKQLDFAYVKVKVPGVEREVWMTVGTYKRNTRRWTVTFDFTFNNNMDDDTSILTGEPVSARRGVRRYAKGTFEVQGKKIKLKIELRDDILGAAAEIEDARMISVKISKG
ncbi:MAG: hypothetical protein IH851_01485 [Armatimonadetes bacterium]|nr:hypothetical protein [Armatimonadota bacterium]